MQFILVVLLCLIYIAAVEGFLSASKCFNKNCVSSLSSTAVDEAIGAVGSKLTNNDLALEAIGEFFPDIDATAVEMIATEGGVNNIVQYLTFPDGSQKLLRIYNNGEDTVQVKFEHTLLSVLHAKNYPDEFDFSIPKYMPSPKDSSSTFLKLSNGAEACIVDFIEGTLPKASCFETIGKASGELNTALGEITEDVRSSAECNCDPYADMWGVHDALTKENFVETMKSSIFDGELRKYADLMLQETISITDKCANEYKSLPEQLIHGDLHYDNVLVKDGKCTGLLDFEFALFDWRAMELATCLSKYAGEDGAIDMFDKFMQGYSKAGRLNALEAKAIPDLINLRVLSNVAYFVGRYLGKQDTIEPLTKRIENYYERVQWIKDNEDDIVATMLKYYPWAHAKPVSTEFKVEKASPEVLEAMKVTQWPTWTTEGSEKYKVGVTSPEKIYDTNELSYIISGSMEITPKSTGVPVKVEAGDFVTFPEDFACTWHVNEVINKHWFCYLEDGSPDI